jgi:putative ATP-dependent endonuclease of the OLD family
MRIYSVTIRNFKSFGPEMIEIKLNDTTALVGGNSTGKSNVLRALDLFFDYSKTKITKDCFHDGDVYQPIEITVILDQLSEGECKTFQRNIGPDKRLRITQKVWITPLEIGDPEGGSEPDEKVEEALDRVQQEKRGVRVVAVNEVVEWLNVPFLPLPEQVESWWKIDLIINGINLKEKWPDNEEIPTPEQYKQLVDEFWQEHVEDVPQINWLNLDKPPTKTDLKTWWGNELIVNGIDFKTYFGDNPPLPEPPIFLEKVQQFWDEQAEQIPVMYYEASEKILGWSNKLKGNLPFFVYIPAIRHLHEEVKPTKTTPYGSLLNWLLGDITRARKVELQKRIESAVKEVFTQDQQESEHNKSRVDRIRDTINRMIQEQFDISLDFDFLPPTVDDILIGNAELIGDDGYRSSVSEKGQGVQRSVIFAILRTYCEHREELEQRGDSVKRTNIFAIEEPENCLHPSIRRATYKLIRNLSKCGDQVIYTTHDGYMVDVRYFDEVRIFRRIKQLNGDWISKVSHFPIQNLILDGKNRYGKDLQEESLRQKFSHFYDSAKNEGFFANKIVLVEGPTEEYVLPVYFEALDFNLDQSQVAIISAGSVQNLNYLYVIFNELEIPCYLIFDGDKPISFDPTQLDSSQKDDLKSKSRRNKELLKFIGATDYIIDEPFFFPSFCDRRATVFEHEFEVEVHHPLPEYDKWKEEATKFFGNDSKPLAGRYIARKAVEAGVIPEIIPQILENVKFCDHRGTCLMLESSNLKATER